MKLSRIPDPFSGEKLADIYPRIDPFVEQAPRLGRLHYFPGRHLTSPAFELEQNVRVERLGLRGRAVTAGVVSGLEVNWRYVAGGIEFRIAPGHALTSAGVDVVVDRTVEVAYEDLHLYDAAIRDVVKLPLGLMEDAPAAAYTAVLVLQPGYVHDFDRPLAAQHEGETDFSPCPRVPEDEVYFKTTTTDAARLILYPLPWNEPPGPQWQNRVAWSIFDRETDGAEIPWNELGVPLAVVGFDDALAPAWLDRHAVVRRAGRPRQRVLMRPTFDARVWTARFDQLCAQVAELSDPLPAASFALTLPPIGLLPKVYLTLTKQPASGTNPPRWEPTQSFFPTGYTVDVSVIPLEQLDALIADTVSLQPYELNQVDAVRLLLPVSQQWFDPELLKIEIIDPKFDQFIALYRATRGKWLAERFDLGNRRHALETSIDGKFTPYPLKPSDEDPKRLENPENPMPAPPGAAVQYGVSRAGSTSAPTYQSQVLAELRAKGEKFRKIFTKEDTDEFRDLFRACGLTPEQTRAALDPIKPPSWLASYNVEPQDATLDNDERNELRRELLAYIKKQLEVHEAEEEKLEHANLEELIAYFDGKAEQADDLVDAGFLKVRTDVFRLGTLLSNNSLASKFVASPSLANIVDRKPPKADTAGVNAFASQLLANFAPSAIASEGSLATGSSPTTGARDVTFMARSSITPTAGVMKRGAAGDFLKVLGQTGNVLESNKDVRASAASKVEASREFSPEEKTAMKIAMESAEQLTSAGIIGQLKEIVDIGNFADSYVANFNLISQKQIRAIPLERLQPPLAPTVRREIHDGRLEIFERLTRLNISLGDLTTDFVDEPGTPVRTTAPTFITRIRFQTLISRRRFDKLTTLSTEETKTINDADESKHFSTGVNYADMAMAALRAVEARIKEYRAFVQECRAALTQTQAYIRQIGTALTPVELEVEESRQDVAVALALKAEEQARLDAINAHREKVLQEHVEIVVYYRPRAVRLNTDVPIRRVEPALTSEPVIDCLRENPTPPADLAALRDVFRMSPARWFKHAPKWIQKVDRWELARTMLERAARTPLAVPEQAPAISQGRYAIPLGKMFQARHVAAQQHVVLAQSILPAALVALTLRDLHVKAEKELTLGHLIAAGPAPLAKAASEELDHIFVVASCLHENFSSVPGLVRLGWAEKFGQFDNVAPDFRDLSRLPSWAKIEFTLRREMQIHADWLFGRIDQAQPDALDLMNDLIRVALLLASHAPVDQLVVGHPVEPEVTPVRGGLIKLKVDPLRVRRGMDVIYKISDTLTMRAVVEDISPTNVAARVIDLPATGAPFKLTSASTLLFKNPLH